MDLTKVGDHVAPPLYETPMLISAAIQLIRDIVITELDLHRMWTVIPWL